MNAFNPRRPIHFPPNRPSTTSPTASSKAFSVNSASSGAGVEREVGDNTVRVRVTEDAKGDEENLSRNEGQ